MENELEFKIERIKNKNPWSFTWNSKCFPEKVKYFPAQLKESYGDSVEGWKNRIYWGDNLQVMSHLLKEFRGKVDLIYIDPPFDSRADYKKKFR